MVKAIGIHYSKKKANTFNRSIFSTLVIFCCLYGYGLMPIFRLNFFQIVVSDSLMKTKLVLLYRLLVGSADVARRSPIVNVKVNNIGSDCQDPMNICENSNKTFMFITYSNLVPKQSYRFLKHK